MLKPSRGKLIEYHSKNKYLFMMYNQTILKKMGVKIKIVDGYIYATAKKGLKGAKINFQKIKHKIQKENIYENCFYK